MNCRSLMLALPLAGFATAGFPQEWTSSYTTHDYTSCRKDKGDGDPVAVHRCPGKAGFTVVWTAGDDSSAVDFGTKAVEETISDAAAFFEAGKTIEWRGPKGQKPAAAILRYATGRNVGRLDGNLLVAYRLAPDGTSCVMGRVDGRSKDANLRARRLVDAAAAGFRCGQDKALDG